MDDVSTNTMTRKPDNPPPAELGAGPVVVFGIKTKLFLSFVALAALTALASAVAWLVFSQIERAVTVITERSIPEISLALYIAEASADITASAPAITASMDQTERSDRREQLDRAGLQLKELIARWETLGIASDVAAGLSGSADSMAALIDTADTAVAERLELTARLQRQSLILADTHDDFLESLEPLIDNAVFDLVIESESSGEETATALKRTVEAGTTRLKLLSTLNADSNLLVGLMREALAHQEPAADEAVGVALRETADTFRADLERLLESGSDTDLERPARELLAFVGQSLQQDVDPAATDAKLAQLAAMHADFVGRIEPKIADAGNQILADTQFITGSQAASMAELVDTGSLTILHLLTLRAEGNLAAGILSEAGAVNDAALLTPLRERFDAAAGQMDRALALLPATLDLTRLRNLIGIQLGLGRDDDTVFDLKRAELDQTDIANRALNEIRSQSVELGSAVAELVRIAEGMSDTTASEAQQVIGNAKSLIVMIAALSILCALLVMLVFVGPRVIRPIEQTTQAMSRLAAGDTGVDIPGRDRQDELGRMAHALGVFRDITIEVQESNLREIEMAQRRLADAIESISEAFSLYDRDDRLVVCNQKYGTLVHPEIADEIQPGLTFEQIIRRALEAGFVEEARGREEEWLTERIARHRDPGSPHTMQRTDGVWIMVSERKTAEGGIVAVYSDITELKERENELAEKSQALEQLSSQLSKYLSPQIYQSIFSGQKAAVVASQRKKLTVFFSDIEGFTETADRLESEDLSQLLNEYLTEMSVIALAHGATIDKYVGDAIMIFFGDPVSHGIRADAMACVRMAIEMQKRLRQLSEAWAEHGLSRPLKCRMGIATGFCTVGNFGSEDRMDYTIIGGTVNLASRLENAAEPGTILIAGETRTLVHNEIPCHEHDTINIKGLAYPVTTYRVDFDSDAAVSSSRISEQRGKLSVDLDLDAMTDNDRREAARLLRDLMQKLDADADEPRG